MELSWDDVAWRRLRRSGLIEPFESAVDVARALVGVQSQFVAASGLAIRNRLGDQFTASDLDDGLRRSRALLRLWGQRNTVHVYDMADWESVVAVVGAIPSYRARLTDLLGRDESDFEAAVARVAEILRGVERASRADFIAADSSLEPWFRDGNALVMALVRRGIACHAALVGGKSYFAHREVWRPEGAWSPPTAAEAGREMARRYFRTYGPATVRDFAFWLGCRVGDAETWIGTLTDPLTEVSVEGTLLLDAVDPREPSGPTHTPPRAEWPLRLLHRFEPLVLAHKEKAWIVDDEHYTAVWRKAGYVEAIVLRRGRIAGTWGYRKKARGIDIWVAPFGKITKRERRIAQLEAEGVASYFESPLHTVQLR